MLRILKHSGGNITSTWLVGLCWAWYAGAAAAEAESLLQLGSMTVEEGVCQLSVLLTRPAPATACDFHVTYDAAVLQFQGIQPGYAALQANKIVTANLLAPGNLVVVVMGFNQEALGVGEIARLAFVPAEGNTAARIGVEEATLSQADGTIIPTASYVGEFSWKTPAPPGETAPTSPTAAAKPRPSASRNVSGNPAGTSRAAPRMAEELSSLVHPVAENPHRTSAAHNSAHEALSQSSHAARPSEFAVGSTQHAEQNTRGIQAEDQTVTDKNRRQVLARSSSRASNNETEPKPRMMQEETGAPPLPVGNVSATRVAAQVPTHNIRADHRAGPDAPSETAHRDGVRGALYAVGLVLAVAAGMWIFKKYNARA